MILKSWRGASGGVAAAARPCPPALPVYSAPSCADRTSATGGAIPARALPNCPPGIRRTRSVVRGAKSGGALQPVGQTGPPGERCPLPMVVGHPGSALAGDRAVAAGEKAWIEGTPLRPASGRRRVHRRPPPLPPPPRRCRRRPGGGGCRQRSGVSRSHAGDGTDGTVPRSPLRIKFHGSPGGTGAGPPKFSGAFRPKVDHGVSAFRPDSHGCCAGHLGRRRWASPPQSTHCAP